MPNPATPQLVAVESVLSSSVNGPERNGVPEILVCSVTGTNDPSADWEYSCPVGVCANAGSVNVAVRSPISPISPIRPKYVFMILMSCVICNCPHQTTPRQDCI